MTALANDHISKAFASGHFYEPAMLDYIRRKYRSGMTMLDIGAHVGNHTIYFHRFCEASRVFSFEPTPISFALLRRNLRRNAICDCRADALNIAIGSREGWAELGTWPEGNTGMATVNPLPNNSPSPPDWAPGAVPLWTLDRFFEGDEVSSIDFIKIDAENMGAEVLRGALRIIREYRPIIFIEAATPEEFISVAGILNPLDYQMRGRWNATPTYEFVHPYGEKFRRR